MLPLNMDASEVSFVEESSFFDETDVSFILECSMNDSNNNPSPEKKVYVCPDCPYKTYKSGNFSRHKKAVHQRARYSCSVCHQQYSSQYDLKEHTRSVHKNSKLMCEVCSRSYSSRKSLNVHRRLVHTGGPKYSCSECNKVFHGIEHYHGHMNKHMKSKPYQCKVCNKGFFYKQSLRRHTSTCAGNMERFRCDQCGKCLSSTTSLNDHIEGVHGEKNKVCICGKAFSWRTALSRHKRRCMMATNS